MQVDLGHYGFDSFHLHAQPSLTDSAVEAILRAVDSTRFAESSDGFYWVVRGAYVRKKRWHVATLSVIGDEDDHPVVIVRYSSMASEEGERPRTRRWSRELRQMQEVLYRLRAPCSVTGYADCNLSEGWEPIVNLPLLTLSTPISPFGEISGIRAIRTEDGKVVESTVLDKDEEGVMVNVRVTFTTTLGANTPVETLRRLRDLRSKMTVRTTEA